MSETKHGIVVGYDGSSGGDRAVEWAAEEAAVRGVPLTVCHVWHIPYQGLVMPPTDEVEEAARLVLAGAIDQARAIAPEVTVRPLLVFGSPGRTLAGFGETATMVVVGRHGIGSVRELMLGSVSSHVASHASGPVVVVRGSREPAPEYYPGRVVVGADGSPAADNALAFAFETAHMHRLPLTAVCAEIPFVEGDGSRVPFVDTAELGRLAGERFRRALDGWHEKYPEIDAKAVMSTGEPAETLLKAAATARLLVVGSRGLGQVRGRLLGSVSQALLHQAPCPVAVVHAPAS